MGGARAYRPAGWFVPPLSDEIVSRWHYCGHLNEGVALSRTACNVSLAQCLVTDMHSYFIPGPTSLSRRDTRGR